MNGRFHTRGRINRLDGQIVWHLSVWCEFMSYCGRLVHLDGQIVFPDDQISDGLFVEKFVRPVCSSDNGLFHTRGRTNRLAFVRLMWIYVVVSSTCSCRRTNRLGKSSFQTAKSQTVCSSKNLFVPFAHQTMAVFTLEEKQIVWMDKSSGICPSDVNLCRSVVDLFVPTDKSSGKIVFPDGQI